MVSESNGRIIVLSLESNHAHLNNTIAADNLLR